MHGSRSCPYRAAVTQRPDDEAFELNERGLALLDADDLSGAAASFEAALAVDSTRAAAWYNLGLVHKRRRDWLASLRCNAEYRRVCRVPLDGDPGMWNLGIAAVALRDWATAREAWSAFGIDLPAGTGPVDGPFGFGPIRVNLGAQPEIVWTRRMNPAQGRIENVPLPTSGRRWHDVLLVDGEPRGERIVAGTTFTVFDEIEVWESSNVPTLRCAVDCKTVEDLNDLLDRFEHAGWGSEDWSASIMEVCDECSTGRPHRHDDHRANRPWESEREVGLATDLRTATELLDEWRRDRRRGRGFERPSRIA